MDEALLVSPPVGPGFRLHKLEVYNWGAFDSTAGQVHTVRPAGQTTLLIGQNGSGKSTLVDALLTLLVRPMSRNYNVAAGAHKQERDERTYIKGACGRVCREEDNRSQVQFLRPAGSHYSALLACFRNDQSDEAFTVAVVLYLDGEGKPQRVYCFAPGERSIAEHCSGLSGAERLRQQMQKRGFKATIHYSEYHSWIARATGLRPKAMDVFNQTVAVKDIQSLNRFIRDHMLEAKPWQEKVDALLNHFTALSEAHQALVSVRRQAELLEPIATVGETYREQARRFDQVQRLLEAADSFFRRKTIDLFGLECDGLLAQLDAVRRKKEQFGRDLAEAQEEARRLSNEIDQSGGERLRQIPLLIRNHADQARAKQEANRRFHQALRQAGITDEATDESAFVAVQARLPALVRCLEERIAAHEKQRDELLLEGAPLRRSLKEEEAELEALAKRRENLPESSARIRRQMCEELQLAEKDLPFVAELLAIKPEERDWEAAIEMVLRGFALSLLVPERYYSLVSRYVERTKLADAAGRGQKLVYLKVGERVATISGPRHRQSLLTKLTYREGHPLLPWVKGELADRFDYRCCESVEEFAEVAAPAMTRQRHVKYRGGRHEKDDRERVTDPRNFVLGWDNQEKRRLLTREIEKLREQQAEIDRRLLDHDKELMVLRAQLSSARSAQEVVEFSLIDYREPEREIELLRLEQQRLEENNEVVSHLKRRLAEAESRQAALLALRDESIRTEGKLQAERAEAERLIDNARSILAQREGDGTLARHQESFAELEASFTEQPLTARTLFEQEKAFEAARRAESANLRSALEPLKDDLGKLMNRFLREFPQERADLEAGVGYLDSYLDVREHIRREDLPRYERRFKERLNEKVTQEIGLLNGAFQTERAVVLAKIDLLNQSLRQLEYRPGTFMRLEPRPVRDGEIVEFQSALKECLAGTFESTLEADEARFVRVEKLVRRLRDEQRWREKVTDVRRWFDFAAREIDRATGGERGYYEDSTGQSGGEKAKLAFTILVAAIAYQYDIDPDHPASDRFHFVVVDEMFSKVDDQYSAYALELFRKFGLQLLIVAPLDAKALVTEPYVGCYLHVVKDARTNRSEVFSMTAREMEEAAAASDHRGAGSANLSRARAR